MPQSTAVERNTSNVALSVAIKQIVVCFSGGSKDSLVEKLILRGLMLFAVIDSKRS